MFKLKIEITEISTEITIYQMLLYLKIILFMYEMINK